MFKNNDLADMSDEQEEEPRGEMEIIKELMEELQEKMKYSEDDLGERLGRPKPEMASIEIEAGPEDDCYEEGDMFGEEQSPEDGLKKRLMKLRG
jgi:hypothetical protein